MITRYAAIALALVLVAINAACGGGDAAPATASAAPTPAPAPVAVPRQQAMSWLYTGHHGKATASLEERIYLADVVVRARLVSASDDVLTFTALNYLKGSGPGRFTVRASTAGRDIQWDAQDAILFLATLDGEAEDFEFTDTTEWDYWPSREEHAIVAREYTGSLPEGYDVKSRNPVWLPIDNGAGGAGGASGQGQADIIVEYDEAGLPETVSAAKLNGLISLLTPPSSGSGAGGLSGSSSGRFAAQDVKDCIILVLETRRLYRDYEADGRPLTAPVGRFSIDSGQNLSTVYKHEVAAMHYIPIPGIESYDSYELSGLNAHLFNARVYDDDNDPLNGYTTDIITQRPLPAGEYRFKHHLHYYMFEPCGFRDEYPVQPMEVTVTAPPGTTHEAFFDPATTTAGVGYFTGATTTGVLKPATFSVGGVSTTITGLKWEGGSVVLSLSPFASLGNNQITFIDLDGSIAFALGAPEATADSAAGTLTWAEADRPWSAGDQLMLRIGPGPDPAPATRSIRLQSPGDTWTISWGAVAGASGYRVQYRTGRAGEWTGLPATTGTSRTFGPQDGLLCGGTTYQFRVQARGDGKTYNTGWGAPSSSLSKTTGACNQPPVFSTSTYAFSVAENTAAWSTAGIVSATDPDGDVVTYSIASGNEAGKFNVDGFSGEILVWSALDFETESSYTLTVEARDGKANGTARATVVITITDVAD